MKAEGSRPQGEKRSTNAPSPKCFLCGRVGHKSPDCTSKRMDRYDRGAARKTEGPNHGGPRPVQRSDKFQREPRCFECGKFGHILTQCPARALYGEGIQACKRAESPDRHNALYRGGTVDGRYVRDILIDTGCTRTLVHQSLVSPRKMITGEVAIRCAHGDEVSYPLAHVNITLGAQVFTVEAGVSRMIPVSVLLGVSESRSPRVSESIEIRRKSSNGNED